MLPTLDGSIIRPKALDRSFGRVGGALSGIIVDVWNDDKT
jgi:hypothetical protein